MKDIIFKQGRWNKIKFLFKAFRMICKAKKFYLIQIEEFKTADGMFCYDYSVLFNGVNRETWEAFLTDHFNTIRKQDELIYKYKSIINNEG